MSFDEALFMDCLEEAGVRGLTARLMIHKARMRGTLWSRPPVSSRLVRLKNEGLLIHRFGYYRLAKYKEVKDFIR
jgi:hypothetical protein